MFHSDYYKSHTRLKKYLFDILVEFRCVPPYFETEKSYLKEESCKRRTEFPMGTSGTKFEYNFFQIQPNSLRMYTLERISKIDYGLYHMLKNRKINLN